MITIYKNGKIIAQANDKGYVMSYETEKVKDPTPYNKPIIEEGGLMNGIQDSY
jgi:hypothetical protein